MCLCHSFVRPARLEEVRQFYKFRPDEIFRRVTITSLVTLMLEQAKLEVQQHEIEDSQGGGGEGEHDIARLETLSDADSAIDNEEEDDDQHPPPVGHAWNTKSCTSNN